MRANGSDLRERLDDLLVERATTGLESGPQRELDALLAGGTDSDPERFDRAVAGVHLALLESPMKSLPESLLRRLQWDAETFRRGHELALEGLPGSAGDAPERSAPRPTSAWASPWVGWTAAAASLLLAFLVFDRESAKGDLPIDGARAQLIEQAADTIVVEWSQTEDPLSAGVSGDVVWSPSRQNGFMRFEGLARNDPARNQYQLWIFDKAQPEATPVDGGVFDVTSDGVAIVSIDPKLAVAEPYLFAVTLEKPGGVVVSSRERLVVAASVN